KISDSIFKDTSQILWGMRIPTSGSRNHLLSQNIKDSNLLIDLLNCFIIFDDAKLRRQYAVNLRR
ncbi:hypothetical protein, partial [Lacihabitans soyangensis]